MTREEFADWKRHPVTKQVFEGLREREAQKAEGLIQSAGVDPSQDRYISGYIAGLRDVYLIDAEDGDTE